ncbi:regucalcin-like [Eriocheir sinensis]|uniref:regucalcin-like n=1 Tax=Eriocheir sinensis TaxID=95602 RepID=UPI0021C613A6|nr:regucalcin-like [Eriocheir sinensis]
MSVSVEAVTPSVGLGEGPHWSVRDQALYYVDIFAQNVHRFDPATDSHTKLHIEGGPVTFVVTTGQTNTFLVSVGRDLCLVTWPDPTQDHVTSTAAATTTTLTSVDPEHVQNRFNDGKCDRFGRLWAGTMGPTDVPENIAPYLGSLYRLGERGEVEKVLGEVSISNGLDWTEDGRTFYFVDTCEYKLEVFDCDPNSGKLANRRTVFDYRKAGLYPSFPDGLAIDTRGRLWVACFGAGKVHCINPKSGQIEDAVTLPTSSITSVTFGGRDLDEMYVTTTTKGLTPDQLAVQKTAGAVFR